MLMKHPIQGTLLGLALLLVLAPSYAVDCEPYEAWDIDTYYPRDTRVTHADHLWRAKRNTEGMTPGTHKPTWADLGACDSGSGGGDPGDGGGGDSGGSVDPTPIQIFGVWHAGNHYADWSQTIPIDEFHYNNEWLIDRGDGVPSVNLVVLSFLQPLEVLNMDTSDPTSGVPPGMTMEIVEYFRDADIRVMMSIGGITYTDFWNEALDTQESATRLGLNAAAIATLFNVGIEIDYEENSNPKLDGLQAFIDAYRSVHPYDASGLNHAARLTIDLAAGGRYLQDLNRHATIHWLDNVNPVLDYANAMVHRASGTPTHWQEHVDGKPTYDPPIPPKAPNRFTGGLFLKGSMDNCTDFSGSEQAQHIDYVQTVSPNGAGTTPGMLGFMFWATGVPSARKNYVPTYPPNSCENGMGGAAQAFGIKIPMEPLRQD